MLTIEEYRRIVYRLTLDSAKNSDWDESKHLRAENGRFGSENGKISAMNSIGQRPALFSHPPVAVTFLSGNEFGSNLTKLQLAKAADALLRAIQKGDGLFNADTGWTLKVNKKGRDKMGDNADLTPNESKAVAGIDSLMNNAVLAENHHDYEHENEFVAVIHRFYAPVSIGGTMYRVKLTVKDYKGSEPKKKLLHALAAVEIENSPLGTLPSSTDESALQTAQPTTGSEISIANLMVGATLYDGRPFK